MRKAFWNKKKPSKIKKNDSIEIKVEKPPIWNDVCAAFNINPQAYFTYGEVIYNPSDLPVPPDIIEHEKVHIKQQKADGMTPELWWGKYLRDPQFRVEQEAKAYGRQYQFICYHNKDRNAQSHLLIELANSLSGPLYNNVISQSEAMTLIRKYAGVK